VEFGGFSFPDITSEDRSVLKTDVDIEKYVKEQLSINEITSIFSNYIIRHNIIGIDNIDNHSFWKSIAAHANHISNSISNYKYSPYMEKLISKGRNIEPRVISIPTIKDRIVLYVLKETLHRIFPESVNAQLVNVKIKELSDIISKENSGKIIKIDLKGFYDSINQQILLDKIKEKSKSNSNSNLFLSLIEKAITNPTVPKKYAKSDKGVYCQYLGIPQGLAISNILANIFLVGFDKKISCLCKYYYRYVDDILLICDEYNYKEIYADVKNFLRRIGLNLNTEKTVIIDNFNEFNFLGYKIKKHTISVKDTSLQSHINSLYAMLCNYKRLQERPEVRETWLTDELLLNRLESDINEKITGAISESKKYGWLFYFNAINDLSILFKMNKIVESALHRLLPHNVLSKLKIKSYVRAYHEIKGNPKSGYIENYDNYDTYIKKREYLQFRGYIDKNGQYTENDINYQFVTRREKNLSRMLKDIGSLS
jgi:hypothetical protein